LRNVAALGVAVASACASVAPQGRDDALRSLVDAERAFAAMSVASGMRAAFAANFAADGIAFEPAPVDAAHAFFSRPEPPNARPLTLDWGPAAAGIAASADFGFTTGPFTLTDRTSGRSLRDGVYFSVWKREPGGAWRVALDAGIGTPSKQPPEALTPSPTLAARRGDAASGRAAIAAIEAQRPTGAQYAQWFADDGRLHRDGHAPVLGATAIRPHLAAAAGTTLAFAPHGSAIASSGDLAYTYGAFSTAPAPATDTLRSGYYAHLWARDATGEWRLVVAVLLPSP
jgi:ketosteroid isomerase-like protein